MKLYHIGLSLPPSSFCISASTNIARTLLHSRSGTLLLGPVLSRSAVRRVGEIPDELFALKNTESMDGNGYLNTNLHQAFHHYIKVRTVRAG